MLFPKASAFPLYSPLAGDDLEEIGDFLFAPIQFFVFVPVFCLFFLFVYCLFSFCFWLVLVGWLVFVWFFFVLFCFHPLCFVLQLGFVWILLFLLAKGSVSDLHRLALSGVLCMRISKSSA